MKPLSPIQIGQTVTDKAGGATLLLLLRWQELIDRFLTVPTQGGYAKSLSDALSSTTVLDVRNAGRYRVAWYLRVTTPGGVSGSVQVTIGWVEGGVAMTSGGSLVNGNLVTSGESGSLRITADGNTAIVVSTTYAANPANSLSYWLDVTAEALV